MQCNFITDVHCTHLDPVKFYLHKVTLQNLIYFSGSKIAHWSFLGSYFLAKYVLYGSCPLTSLKIRPSCPFSGLENWIIQHIPFNFYDQKNHRTAEFFSNVSLIPHCVLLKHYYSTDFPWQFDRKMTKPLITWWLEKKVVKWQKFKSALCNLTQKLLLLNFVSMQFLTEISNQSGSQIHAWILLKKKFYCIKIYSFFCRASPFHREWPQLATILTSFDLSFGTKSKSLIFELKQAIHGGKDLNCKK